MNGRTLDPRDILLSRKLREIAEKVDALVTEELGEQHTIGLVIQPTTGVTAEFQYISNGPREFMHEAFRTLVANWDAGYPGVPPHKRQ